MRIVIASDLYAPVVNGVATFAQTIAEGLAQDGHQVLVIAPSEGLTSSREKSDQFEIARVRSVSIRLYPVRVVINPRPEIKKILDEFQPDVIHIQTPMELGRNCMLEGRRRHIPVIATGHSMPENIVENFKVLLPLKYPVDKILRIYGAHFGNRADFVTFPTKSAFEILTDHRFKAPYAVVSNGIDTKLFHPDAPDPELVAKYHLPNEPVVLYSGRLDGEKHMDVWLKAFAEARKTTPMHALIGGKGNAKAGLETLAQELGIAKHVTFAGFVPDDELTKFYHLGDIFAITSPAELQSITTLEAAASGLPIVAVDAVALPELCHNGVNGCLFDFDDADGMAKHLVKLAQDANLRQNMGAASRQIALPHEFARTVETFEKIYTDQIKLKSQTPRPKSLRDQVSKLPRLRSKPKTS